MTTQLLAHSIFPLYPAYRMPIKILCQILSLCLVSHHSGLIDCLKTDNHGTLDSYSKRLSKDDKKTHRDECIKNADKSIIDKIDGILADKSLTKPFEKTCRDIVYNTPGQKPQSTIAQFKLGLLARFLFSALIDADRQDTADTEKPKNARHRLQGKYQSWDKMIERLENKYKTFIAKNRVDEIRKEISAHCLHTAKRPPGLFALTVPTAGGKTLASLRFALHHAKERGVRSVIVMLSIYDNY